MDVRRRKKAAGTPAWRWGARVLAALAVLLVLCAGGFAGTIAYYGRDLPDVRTLRELREPQTTRIVDRDGELLGELFEERRTVVPLDRIPRVLVLSVLAAEDADFYRHEGLDYLGLFRAVVMGVLNGGNFRGTSTITQQVVKNLLLDSERSVSRKIRELILARELEEEFTKDEILALYLNHINFGHGRYGVAEAARFYFDCDVSELTLAQASLLAGIPQSPTNLSPRTHPEAARVRQRYVLDQLEEKRDEYWPDLSLEDIRAAREAPIELAAWPESNAIAPEVMEVARTTLADLVGEEEARTGGYVVHTSIDRATQEGAREALRVGLRAWDERHHARPPFESFHPRHAGDRPPRLETADTLRVGGTYDAVVLGRDDATGLITLDLSGHEATASISDLIRYNPDELTASAFVENGHRTRASVLALPATGADGASVPARARLEFGPEGAAVVIDPRTRDVLALVGGYESSSGFDRATSALRQPGSTFKPIVYAFGVHSRRYTPASIVIDAPGVYDTWQPHNFETWDFHGEMRLRDALANSVNQVAIRVIEDLGPAEVVTFAQALGITSPLEPSLALALGASEVRPIELCNAYATFAAGGRWAPWNIITRIERPDGTEVELPAREAARDVMTPAEAYVITSLLRSVVESGTARSARSLGRPAVGKTGTSNEARDAWFAGYTPEVVSVVWVGFDDHRALGRRETGTRAALPIWIDVIRSATDGVPVTDFPVPSGVVTVRIDRATGLLAPEGADEDEVLDEVFVEGTEPTEAAPERDVLAPVDFLMGEFEESETEAEEDATPSDGAEPTDGAAPGGATTPAPADGVEVMPREPPATPPSPAPAGAPP